MRINEQRFRYVFESPQGPVGRHLGRVGARIASTAKALVTEEKLVRTGRYRASLAWQLLNDGRGLVLRVGSALDIARLIERGSPAHIIRASNKRALWWDMPNDRGWAVQPDDGRPVPSVPHPGTRAYMIIHRAVAAVLGRG